MNIPNNAVEAAVRAEYEESAGKEWSPGDGQHILRRIARAGLEAAAPFIAAQIVREQAASIERAAAEEPPDSRYRAGMRWSATKLNDRADELEKP